MRTSAQPDTAGIYAQLGISPSQPAASNDENLIYVDYQNLGLIEKGRPGEKNDMERIREIVAGLYSYNRDDRLDVNLSNNYFGLETAKLLAGWLASGKAPKHTTLRLNMSGLDGEATCVLLRAANDELAPKELHLSLNLNYIDERYVQAIAAEIKKVQHKLNLSLSDSMGSRGVAALQAAQERVAEQNKVKTSVKLAVAHNYLETEASKQGLTGGPSVENYRWAGRR